MKTEAELADLVSDVLAVHRYGLGSEGIVCDGFHAWLQCSCGWKEYYEMPEDDIVLAERVWDRHRAEAVAASLTQPVFILPEKDLDGSAAVSAQMILWHAPRTAEVLVHHLSPWRECTGASDCLEDWHEHGCYADDGQCSDPKDHQS